MSDMPTPDLPDDVLSQPATETRLCPSCNAIRDFADGRCLNCGYRAGEAGLGDDAAAYGFRAAPAGPSPAMKWVMIGLLVVLLGVGGYFVWPLIGGKHEERSATDAQTAEQAAQTVANGGKAADPNATHAGALDAVVLDDPLHERIAAALRGGNEAWSQAGRNAYAYRYSVYENTVPATSQEVVITAFVGGKDAATAIIAPSDEPMRKAAAIVLTELNGHDGVTATLDLSSTEGKETPSENDRYIVYGYYYGQEHWSDIEPIVKALKSYKEANGQYPLQLSEGILSGIHTKGGPNFDAAGFGYIPVFRTDGAGNIAMGSGGTIARLTPAEVLGYYLLAFTRDPNTGLDLFSTSDLQYYTAKISPFPYQAGGPVHNMELKPDGKPDGVAAKFKDGRPDAVE